MNILDVVVLRDDLPDEGLRAGQVGTIVEEWQPGVYEVEFANAQGQVQRQKLLHASQFMLLHWEIEASAASLEERKSSEVTER